MRLWALLISVVLITIACGRTGTSPDSSSRALEALKSIVAPKPTIITDEELQKVLRNVDFDPEEWGKTNFKIHSVLLTEFSGGGPPKDGIPALSRPKFEGVEQAGQWLADREPVQVVEINGDARAYPQQVLIWHEIVNDVVGGEPIAITY